MRWGDDRGSASVWLLGVALGVFAFAAVIMGLTAALVAKHRAQSAADLGALAGAARAVEGGDRACERAREVAEANGARLVGCRLDGLDVIVRVEVDPASAAAAFGPVRASARAGPARETGYAAAVDVGSRDSMRSTRVSDVALVRLCGRPSSRSAG